MTRPIGLIPNFVRGAVIVGQPVGGIAVLIGIEIFIGIGGDHLLHATDGAIGGFVAGGHDQFRPISGKHALAFVGSAVGEAEGDRITEGCANHGVGDAGVAAGGVDDGFAGGELAALKTSVNHTERRAVFYRAAGIEPFGFAADFHVFKFAADAGEAQQRAVTDARENGFANAAGGGLTGVWRNGAGGGHILFSLSKANRD